MFLQPVQDLTVEDRVSRTQYQYTLEDADPEELNRWAPKLVEVLQTLPELRDVSSDQQDQGLASMLVIDRNTASRMGITPQLIVDTLYDAFGQRQVSTMFTQLNQYRVVLEVMPEFQQGPRALQLLDVRSLSGGQVPLNVFTQVTETTTPLVISRQGQFPAVTLSFNLAPGGSLGDAVDGDRAGHAGDRLAAQHPGNFQGTAQAFQASLENQPLLILAALVTVYIVLGILYESYIHPLTILSTLPSAGVGALLALMLFRTEFSVIALIGIILLDRHRQEERHHDDRLCAGGGAQGGETAGGGDLRGLPAPVPADHDDDDGGLAWRIAAGDGYGCRIGIAATARHCHRRRADREPDTDALYDTGGVPRIGSIGATVAGAPIPDYEPRSLETGRHEHLGSVHSSSRRHHVADDRRHTRRGRGVPIPSRGVTASSRVSDHQRVGVLPGASPETMATSVAAPLERQFTRIAGVTEMTSTSTIGGTNITLQFELNRDIDGAARDVQAAINAARADLPSNLPISPEYRKVNPADGPMLILAVTSDIVSRGEMYDAASSILQQKLSQVEGVGQVTVGGGSLPAVRVDLNPTALNKYGIGLGDVRRMLTGTNVNRPKGQLTAEPAPGRSGPTISSIRPRTTYR